MAVPITQEEFPAASLAALPTLAALLASTSPPIPSSIPPSALPPAVTSTLLSTAVGSSAPDPAASLAALPSLAALLASTSPPIPSSTPASVTTIVTSPTIAVRTPTPVTPVTPPLASSDPALLAALPPLTALVAAIPPPVPSGSVLSTVGSAIGAVGSALGSAASTVGSAVGTGAYHTALSPYYAGSAIHSYLKTKEADPARVAALLAALPTLTALLSTTYRERKESGAFRDAKILGSRLMQSIALLTKSKPKPKAITAELMADKEPWNLAKPTLQAPDMKRLATLELPTATAHHDIPSGIPAWVPKTVAAELDLNPECDRGGFVGPTCLPTTMHKHILELEDYNENRSFSKGAFWKSSRDKFKAAKEKQPKSTSEQKEFDAKYPETYSIYLKDTSGNVPSVVSVFSPYHTMDERKAGKFRSTNLAALARIAPPEMIFSETNKSEQVKDMTIALLESLAFCGSKKTLDDPDCEPLRILAEIREFHAGQRAALAKQQTDESRRLTGPWAPIERIIRLIEGYVPTERDRGTIDVKEEPRPPTPVGVVTLGGPGGPGGPTKLVVPPSASTSSAFYMPTIPFRIPLPFSASFSSPELSLPSLFGATNFSTRI